MKTNDLFLRIRDYIEGDVILDELQNFMLDDEFADFCEHLREKYDIDLSEDMDEYYDDELF